MEKKRKLKIKKWPIFLVVIAGIIGLYFFTLTPINKKDDKVIVFNIKSGTSANNIMKNLHEAGLIRSNLSALIYYRTHLSWSIKAGAYELSKNMSTNEILKTFNEGKTIGDLKITFIEGKRIPQIANLIASKLGISEKDVLGVMNDKKFLESLIQKYWFLTDEILDDEIFYPLEGYLFPDTYLFAWDSSVETVVTTMLNNMSKKLEMYRNTINNGKYSVHQILTMASISELEAVSESDRRNVQGVINNRLKRGMSLGMDVTTYYAVQKDMGLTLSNEDFQTVNAYNTRGSGMEGKLPIGPICNPSLMSIEAYFEPLNNDYLYFYANTKTGKVYFAKTESEQYQNKQDVLSGKK